MPDSAAICLWLQAVADVRENRADQNTENDDDDQRSYQRNDNTRIPLDNLTTSRKRKRTQDCITAFPSPDPESDWSIEDTSTTSTLENHPSRRIMPRTTPSTPSPSKRRRATGVQDDRGRDQDRTPRAPVLQPPLKKRSSASSSSSPDKASDTSSWSRSGASSARRQLSSLPLSAEGIVKGQLYGASFGAAAAPPDAIQDALRYIRRLERGRGILHRDSSSPSDPSEDLDLQSMLREFDLEDDAFATNLEASRLRSEDVHSVAHNAWRCYQMDQDEAVWNAEVHNPLLSKVLRGLEPVPPRTLVDFTLWSVLLPAGRAYLNWSLTITSL